MGVTNLGMYITEQRLLDLNLVGRRGVSINFTFTLDDVVLGHLYSLVGL